MNKLINKPSDVQQSDFFILKLFVSRFSSSVIFLFVNKFYKFKKYILLFMSFRMKYCEKKAQSVVKLNKGPLRYLNVGGFLLFSWNRKKSKSDWWNRNVVYRTVISWWTTELWYSLHSMCPYRIDRVHYLETVCLCVLPVGWHFMWNVTLPHQRHRLWPPRMKNSFCRVLLKKMAQFIWHLPWYFCFWLSYFITWLLGYNWLKKVCVFLFFVS